MRHSVAWVNFVSHIMKPGPEWDRLLIQFSFKLFTFDVIRKLTENWRIIKKYLYSNLPKWSKFTCFEFCLILCFWNNIFYAQKVYIMVDSNYFNVITCLEVVLAIHKTHIIRTLPTKIELYYFQFQILTDVWPTLWLKRRPRNHHHQMRENFTSIS